MNITVFQTRVPLFLEGFPDTTSVKNVAHFGQMVDVGDRMQKYNYGAIGNWEHYKQVVSRNHLAIDHSMTRSRFSGHSACV